MNRIHVPPQPGSPERASCILPLSAFSSYLLLGGIFCIFATLGFAWLADEIFENELSGVDISIITWLHGYWGPANDQVMIFFTTMGDPVILALLIALVAVALLRYGRWIDAIGLVVAGAGAGILNQL